MASSGLGSTRANVPPIHSRHPATWQLVAAWGLQASAFLALWLSDNPQWVWYSLLRGNYWVGVLAALFLLGALALVVFGLRVARNERVVIWPIFVPPSVVIVSGALAASLVYGRIMKLSDVHSVRESGLSVYAAASANAQSVLTVAFFATAFLSLFAAPIFLARANVGPISDPAHRTFNLKSRVSVRVVATLASVLAVVVGFGVGWSLELVVTVLSIVGASVLVASVHSSTSKAQLRTSSLGYMGLLLGVSHTCFAASFLAWTRAKLFRFFDHPNFSPDALAGIAQTLERAQVTFQTLQWLLLLSLCVVLTGLVASGGLQCWRWTILPLLPFVVGAGSLVSEPISDVEVERLGRETKAELHDKLSLPVAFLGRPGVWSGVGTTLLVASHAKVVLNRPEAPVELQASNLLRLPECRTRLANVKSMPGTVIAAEGTLDTRELDCLLVGSLGLQTSDVESDGASGVAPALASKLSFLLEAHLPPALARYSDALYRHVTVELGVAEKQEPKHVFVKADAWELVLSGKREQLTGGLPERATKLLAGLGGDTVVSVDAEPSLPISQLLNAVIAIEAKPEVRSVLKWISGVSGPPAELNHDVETSETRSAFVPTVPGEHASNGALSRKNRYDELVRLTTLPFEKGGLSHAVVDEVTRTRMWELGSCYSRLRAKANVSGIIEFRVSIARNGLVDEIPVVPRAPKPAPGLVTCARQALTSLRYPESSRGTPDVHFSIEFGH